MTPRDYWQSYVDRNGGLPAVADKLCIPYPTLYAVGMGRRGIGHRLADRMVKADPSLDATVLIWVRPLQPIQSPLSNSTSPVTKRAA